MSEGPHRSCLRSRSPAAQLARASDAASRVIEKARTPNEREAAFKRLVRVRARIVAKHRAAPPRSARHLYRRGEPRPIAAILPEAFALIGAGKGRS